MGKVSDAIIEMLTENTGASMLDSGSHYGRHHEQNQSRDFASEPAIRLDVSEDQVIAGLSTYHFLNAFLEIDAESESLDANLQTMINESDDSYYDDMQTFAQNLLDDGDIESFSTFNSYNFENIVDQTLQGVILTPLESEDNSLYEHVYVILQIHGGCDVRGGYTRPRIFKIIDIGYFRMAMDNINCYCTNSENHNQARLPECKEVAIAEHDYYSDDCGYHWYGRDSGESIEFSDMFTFDPKANKVLCKICGAEMEFYGHLDI